MGAFATRRIRKGERIIEYVGERISAKLADERYDDEAMARAGTHYTLLFTVNKSVVIDATFGGNDSKFINHSCAPNCEAVIENKRVFIDSLMRANLPRGAVMPMEIPVMQPPWGRRRVVITEPREIRGQPALNSFSRSLTDALRDRWGHVDGALHAIAFAPEDALGGRFMSTAADSATARHGMSIRSPPGCRGKRTAGPADLPRAQRSGFCISMCGIPASSNGSPRAW